jgi:phospholipase/lecithinase/hemolysin
MRKIISVGFLLATVFVLPPVLAATPKYEAFYVFGDSLSDTGNDLFLTKLQKLDPPLPPSESPHKTYYQGRFSNGPVAAEYLWRQLRQDAALVPFLSNPSMALTGGISFAFGGSTSGYLNQMPGGLFVPGVLGQIELYRKALKGKQPKTKLYVVWTGANDYLMGRTEQPGEVIINIVKAIQTLYSLGARDFLIPNLPDLGLTPMVQMTEGGPAQFLALTQTHNALLAEALNQLRPRLRGIQIFHVDLFTLSQNLLSDTQKVTIAPPALEFLVPGIGASECFVVDPSTCPDVDFNAEAKPPHFAFWDMMHPTTFIHKLYGEAMRESLNDAK